MPLHSEGKIIDPPALPSRIEYALRRIGGLRGLNQVTADSRPFMYKDFCGAYNQAPIAESLSPQLAESFGTSRLLGQPKQLCKQVQTTAVGIRRFKPKPIPMPLTPEQELGSEATPGKAIERRLRIDGQTPVPGSRTQKIRASVVCAVLAGRVPTWRRSTKQHCCR